jgi:hypothetical protein
MYDNLMASYHKDLLEVVATWKKPYWCKKLQQKGHIVYKCMGIQWHQFNQKDLLEVAW